MFVGGSLDFDLPIINGMWYTSFELNFFPVQKKSFHDAKFVKYPAKGRWVGLNQKRCTEQEILKVVTGSFSPDWAEKASQPSTKRIENDKSLTELSRRNDIKSRFTRLSESVEKRFREKGITDQDIAEAIEWARKG